MTEHNAQFKAWSLDRAIEVAKLQEGGATVTEVLANALAICDFAYVEESPEELKVLEAAKALEVRENAVALIEKEREIVDREETVELANAKIETLTVAEYNKKIAQLEAGTS